MNWAQRYVDVTISSLMTLANPVVTTIGAWLVYDQVAQRRAGPGGRGGGPLPGRHRPGPPPARRRGGRGTALITCAASARRPGAALGVARRARRDQRLPKAAGSALEGPRQRASLSVPRGRGSAGRASPCQGEGRGFESRRPLQAKYLRGGPLRRASCREIGSHDPSSSAGPGAKADGVTVDGVVHRTMASPSSTKAT